MKGGSAPRHILWRRAYRDNRYCQHLSQAELNHRIRDIVNGMMRTTPEAKVGPGPITDGSVRYMELWTHVLEEMGIRHGPFPNGFTREIHDSEPFPDFAGDLGRRTAALLSKLELPDSDVLIRFGKATHMQALLEEGQLRVSPASYYATPTHNGAVRDDEMALSVSLSITRDQVLSLVINPQDVPADLINHRVDMEHRFESDYWIYCLTTTAEPRLFVDFDADACVVISDKEEFTRRLLRASAERLGGTRFRAAKVEYIDPLLPSTTKINIPHSKHFRYEYQSEFRFVWLPTQPRGALPSVDLALGNLRDIAKIVLADASLGA